MSTTRLIVLATVLAFAFAGAVALVSRTPAGVRDGVSPESSDPSLGARFSDAEVARHGAYRGPGYLAFAAGTALQLAVLVMLAGGPFSRWVDSLGRLPGGWPVRALVAAAAISLVLFLVGLPLAYVRGYVMQHAWHLSTQDLGGWLSDQLRGLLVGAVTLGVTALAFYGVVRWAGRTWWLWGWGALTALTALLVFLYPVVIAPLFYKFTPLRDAELTREIKTLAEEAGVPLDEVLVADASRRSTAENAYVAGLGKTKQLVLYDTLLASGDEQETLFVVAHELGHNSHNHVVKNIVVASIGLFAGFAVLAWLAGRPGIWSWAHASGVGDIRALPLLLAFALVAGLIALPVQNAVSRRFEAEADRTAISLTLDPDTAVRAFRRLAFSNIADLRPPDVAVWALFSHPPIPDRITTALEAASANP